jgi:hypothetical protein
MCCKGGKISLPYVRSPPRFLRELLNFEGGRRSRLFLHCSVNNGNDPPVFKISGQVYHRIGSLLPAFNALPKFGQLYMYVILQMN